MVNLLCYAKRKLHGQLDNYIVDLQTGYMKADIKRTNSHRQFSVVVFLKRNL